MPLFDKNDKLPGFGLAEVSALAQMAAAGGF